MAVVDAGDRRAGAPARFVEADDEIIRQQRRIARSDQHAVAAGGFETGSDAGQRAAAGVAADDTAGVAAGGGGGSRRRSGLVRSGRSSRRGDDLGELAPKKGEPMKPPMASGGEAAAGVPKGYGCDKINKKFTDTCNGYASYIDQCPSFVHNICHEDMGGSERLRSPCPDHLICYYCLRINPLYCIE